MTKLNLSRRSMLIGTATTTLAAPSIVSANILGGGPLGQGTTPLTHGIVTVADFGDVKIHSYQSPDLTGCVTTHVIETPANGSKPPASGPRPASRYRLLSWPTRRQQPAHPQNRRL